MNAARAALILTALLQALQHSVIRHYLDIPANHHAILVGTFLILAVHVSNFKGDVTGHWDQSPWSRDSNLVTLRQLFDWYRNNLNRQMLRIESDAFIDEVARAAARRECYVQAGHLALDLHLALRRVLDRTPTEECILMGLELLCAISKGMRQYQDQIYEIEGGPPPRQVSY